MIWAELTTLIAIVSLALLFGFLNGYNDAANSVATMIATRVLPPWQAVSWAAFFHFTAAFVLGPTIALQVAEGLVQPAAITQLVLLSGLLSAIGLVGGASYLGLPVSASQALLGGVAGGAAARAGLTGGWTTAAGVLAAEGWLATIAWAALAPLLGLAAAGALFVLAAWAFRGLRRQQLDLSFRRLQLLSSAVFSLSHGSHGAQRAIAIVVAALAASGFAQTDHSPVWAILSCHGAIAAGTLLGGWRVTRTLGNRLTKLDPMSGFSAQTGGAAAFLWAMEFGIPASSTQTVAGAIIGSEAVRERRAVRWRTALKIAWAWILTFPITIAAGMLAYAVVYLLGSPI